MLHDEKVDELVNSLYEKDHKLGFCGHDITGNAMENIVNHVITKLMWDDEWLVDVLFREGHTRAAQAVGPPILYDQDQTNRPTTHIGEGD